MKQLTLLLTFLSISVAARAGTVSYSYFIDTSLIAAQNGYLDFQFSAAPGTPLPASVDLINFDPDGGILDLSVFSLLVLGDVTGDLPGTVMFTLGGSAVNEYSPGFQYGNSISFQLNFNWTDPVTPADAPASFFFSMLDDSFGKLLTNAPDPFTYALQADLNPNGTLTANTFNTPEPGSFVPVAGGLLCVLLRLSRTGRRKQTVTTLPMQVGDVTRLLDELNGGDASAIDRLTPLIYDELHRLAERRLRSERPDHTLQPTALVHEAYLRMLGQQKPDFTGRSHFLAICARVMRQILVDHSRRVNAARRGSGEKQPLDAAAPFLATDGAEILELDMALNRLAEQDPMLARLTEMRYFGGLTAEESACLTGLEVKDVRKGLRMAQAWLSRELGSRANSASA